MDRRVRGRDSELELLGEFIGTPGGVLLLEGPAGIGKTRLLTEAKEIARRAGVRVAAADAFEGQRTVPFATLLSALLEGSDPVWSAEGLEHLRRESDFSYWIIEELQDVLERAALQGPLLVALDDLHFADAGTLVALRTLVSRTAELPIGWVFALRPGESRAELRELLQRLEHARRVELGPLCDDAVAAVLADRLDAPGEPALLQLAATARGNAFLLVELLEGLREEGRVTLVDGCAHVRGGELPARLAESMRDRLDRLGNDACQVVRVAAVLGQRFTAEELAAVLHSRPSQLLEPIDEAVRADMLSESRDRLSFRHELLRQAVLGTLPLSVRRSLQREVATALIEHGASAVHVAAQVAESAMPGDEWAVEHLRAAARELSPTDAEAAADMSLRALELSPANSSTRGALLIETLAFLHGALRDDEADALAAEALEGALTTEEQAEVRLSLSTRLSRPELQRAEENRRALQLPGLSPRMRARHHGWLAYSLANAGLVDEAQEHAEDALATAGTDDAPARALAILALSTVAMRRGEYTAALAQLEEVDGMAAAAEGPLVPCLTELRRAESLGMLGRLDEAAVLLGDNLARQRRERRACLEGAWLAMGSHLRFMAGALEDAVENAEAAEALGFPFSATPGGAGAMLARLQVALHTGDSKRRRAALTTAHRTHAGRRPGGALGRELGVRTGLG